MTKDQYLKGLYAIERVLDGCEGRHSPKQFEVHKECLEYAIKVIRGCEAEDCRSLKDIKEMVERKADELDGQMLDAGGVCIGLYFAIANDLPSVYPKSDKPSGKWIPVSERLPDTEDEVLCWYEYYHWSKEKILPEYGIGQYIVNEWYGEVSTGLGAKVIAWQPLPKPYVMESEPQKSEDNE